MREDCQDYDSLRDKKISPVVAKSVSSDGQGVLLSLDVDSSPTAAIVEEKSSFDDSLLEFLQQLRSMDESEAVKILKRCNVSHKVHDM